MTWYTIHTESVSGAMASGAKAILHVGANACSRTDIPLTPTQGLTRPVALRGPTVEGLLKFAGRLGATCQHQCNDRGLRFEPNLTVTSKNCPTSKSRYFETAREQWVLLSFALHLMQEQTQTYGHIDIQNMPKISF